MNWRVFLKILLSYYFYNLRALHHATALVAKCFHMCFWPEKNCMPPRNRIQLDISFHRRIIIIFINNDINNDVVNDLELSQRQRSNSLDNLSLNYINDDKNIKTKSLYTWKVSTSFWRKKINNSNIAFLLSRSKFLQVFCICKKSGDMLCISIEFYYVKMMYLLIKCFKILFLDFNKHLI